MNFSFIPVPILFVVTTLACIIVQTINVIFVKRNTQGLKAVMLRNGLFFGLSSVVIFALSGFKIRVSWYTVITSVAFGLTTMLYYLTTMQAYKFGPYGYTTVIITLSTVISALSGVLFFDETFDVFKIVGVTLMAFCIIFAVDNKNDEKGANLKWFILSVVSMLLCAGVGILQKTHQSSVYKDELMGFLVLSFVISTAFYLIAYLILRKKQPQNEQFTKEDKKKFSNLMIITAVVGGVFTALNNCLNLYLSGIVDSAIMFPIVNGIPLMGGIIVSFVFFKEKLSKKQLLGLIIGVIAIVFLCI